MIAMEWKSEVYGGIVYWGLQKNIFYSSTYTEKNADSNTYY